MFDLRNAVDISMIIHDIYIYICIYMTSHLHAAHCSFEGPNFMRPLAAGVASGGLSGLLVSIAQEALWASPALTEFERSCLAPLYQWTVLGIDLDPKSLIIGICIGLFLGPILEVICLLRHLAAIYLRRAFIGQVSAHRKGWRFLDEHA